VLYTPDPQVQLQQMHAQGLLALSGFGQLQQEHMLELRGKVLSHLSPWLATPSQDLPAQVFHLKAHNIDVALRWGGDAHTWRLRADGSALQLNLRPGKVLNTSGHARLDTLAGLWLGHLCANAAGVATTSLQSGEDGLVGFLPLPAEEAKTRIEDLVAVYLMAWQHPLPLACKTACAWLMAMHFPGSKTTSEQDIQAKAFTAARQAFEGGYYRTGERDASTLLQRAFAEFEDLWPELPVWAERVYGPMLQALIPAHEAVEDTQTDQEVGA
jgi:exodeoxyribonuclease V gamma subunit